MRLSREVRFALTREYDPVISNSWSGWPSTNLVVPRLSIITEIEGQPAEPSGYICNIKIIDQVVRDVIQHNVLPKFKNGLPVEALLISVFSDCLQAWSQIDDLQATIIQQTVVVTPQLKYTIYAQEPNMVRITQQFEFSASHRLHNDSLTAAENQELFGKCNNPNGHGHNYVVEVSLDCDMEKRMETTPLPAFETKVKELVIDRLDHKHLNHDVEYFSRVNPSVENIAIAIWDWLQNQFGDDQLANVRVYETPKTWADYSG